MEPKTKSNLTNIVKGVGLIALGVGLGYAAIELQPVISDLIQEESKAVGTPMPPHLKTIYYSPVFASGLSAITSAYQGL